MSEATKEEELVGGANETDGTEAGEATEAGEGTDETQEEVAEVAEVVRGAAVDGMRDGVEDIDFFCFSF